MGCLLKRAARFPPPALSFSKKLTVSPSVTVTAPLAWRPISPVWSVICGWNGLKTVGGMKWEGWRGGPSRSRARWPPSCSFSPRSSPLSSLTLRPPYSTSRVWMLNSGPILTAACSGATARRRERRRGASAGSAWAAGAAAAGTDESGLVKATAVARPRRPARRACRGWMGAAQAAVDMGRRVRAVVFWLMEVRRERWETLSSR